MRMKALGFCVAMLALMGGAIAARAHMVALSPETETYVSIHDDVVALTHARVIDGTGALALEDQTLLIMVGKITALGPSAVTDVPEGARVIDLSGQTILPGLVMVHEHLFYPIVRGYYNNLTFSAPKLYLAGGVTTMRTAGSMAPYTDLNLKRAIDTGLLPGPKMHVTGPFLNGQGLPILSVPVLRDADHARERVAFWSREGATSFKAYMQISRAELGAAIEEAHKQGHKVTGHLCSVTYREATDLGIDNLEHGFMAATDFVADKDPDTCPSAKSVRQSLLDAPIKGRAVRSLIRHLVDNNVAMTSTLPVFETFAKGRPIADSRALAAMDVRAREFYMAAWSRVQNRPDDTQAKLFEKEWKLERAFVKAGGLLLNGTDPTGFGGVVAGFANQRAVELLVEAGFSPLQAIRISTLNGATFLEVDNETGTVSVGKAADLMVVDGAPDQNIADIKNVTHVFKDGVGYDPSALIEATKGLVGVK